MLIRYLAQIGYRTAGSADNWVEKFTYTMELSTKWKPISVIQGGETIRPVKAIEIVAVQSIQAGTAKSTNACKY